MTTLLLLLCLLPAPADGYGRPAAETVLRTGPGHDFPGLLEVDASTVLRLGEVRGVFRAVHVPQGFPIYLHREYADVDEARAEVRVTGNRVNARMLPTTEGHLPIGQLEAGDGPLVLLGVEGRWVRVLAPVDTALYAPAEALTEIDADAGAALFAEQTEAREGRRAARVNAYWVNHPPPEPVEVAAVPEPAPVPVEQSIAEIRERETLELEILDREARFLGLGLMFAGRGEAVSHRGTVVRRETSPGVELFTLETNGREIAKLTAPINRPALRELVGKRVEIYGREMTLSSVRGPVLVVDEVLWQAP